MKPIFRILITSVFITVTLHGMQPVPRLVIETIDNQTSRPATVNWDIVVSRTGERNEQIPLPANKITSIDTPLLFPIPKNQYYHLNILADDAKGQNLDSFQIVIWQEGQDIHVKTIHGVTLSIEESVYQIANKKSFLNVAFSGDRFQKSVVIVSPHPLAKATQSGSIGPVRLQPKVAPKAAAVPKPSAPVKLVPKVLPKPAIAKGV